MFLGTSCLVYVTPAGLNNVMVIGTRVIGACEGPPTTVLATMGALVGAGTRAATWCVSWRHLVTDGGTKALLTIVCACVLPFPFPPLRFLLGAPLGASPDALERGGADLFVSAL